jgi:hypothetical protein
MINLARAHVGARQNIGKLEPVVVSRRVEEDAGARIIEVTGRRLTSCRYELCMNFAKTT